MEVKPQIVKHGSFMLTELECEKLIAALEDWCKGSERSNHPNTTFVRSLMATLYDLRREFS
jgi:hypothetical protein